MLALGPGLAVTLCGLDSDAHVTAAESPVREEDRLFDVVWSLDPEVAATAAEVVVDALRRSAPEKAEEVRVRLAHAVQRPPTPAETTRAAPSSSEARGCGVA